MKSWEQFWAENAAMNDKHQEQVGGSSGSGGGGGGGLLSGGGGGFDPGGEMQTSGFKEYSAGEKGDYRSLMGNGLAGSKKFTDAEIKRGYRKL